MMQNSKVNKVSLLCAYICVCVCVCVCVFVYICEGGSGGRGNPKIWYSKERVFYQFVENV